MTVSKICCRSVDSASGEDSALIAAKRMQSRNVGTLVVLDKKQRPIGLVTDRDLTLRVLAEGLEGQQLDRTRAEHRPHGHLDGAGVGAGDDADQEVGRNAQHLTGAVDRQLQLRLAGLAAMRASEDGVIEGLWGPAGSLGAWA